MKRPLDVPARMSTAGSECLTRRFVGAGVVAMAGIGMGIGL